MWLYVFVRLYSVIASGSFERVCVLFNIAAMQSQIAETQNIGSDDGRKMAAKLFQVILTEEFFICRMCKNIKPILNHQGP